MAERIRTTDMAGTSRQHSAAVTGVKVAASSNLPDNAPFAGNADGVDLVLIRRGDDVSAETQAVYRCPAPPAMSSRGGCAGILRVY